MAAPNPVDSLPNIKVDIGLTSAAGASPVGSPVAMSVRDSTFRPRPLAAQKSIIYADQERAALRLEFNKFDKDSNGILDETEFRAYLAELKLDPTTTAKILAKYDTNGDKTIEFEEFLIAAEQFKAAVLAGVMKDAMKLSLYYQIGCACCLCTLGLSWIPFCCLQNEMEQRTTGGKYVQELVANKQLFPSPAGSAPAAQQAPAAPASAAVPVQPTAVR